METKTASEAKRITVVPMGALDVCIKKIDKHEDGEVWTTYTILGGQLTLIQTTKEIIDRRNAESEARSKRSKETMDKLDKERSEDLHKSIEKLKKIPKTIGG